MNAFRKTLSVICFLIFLAALPGLFNGLSNSSDPAFLFGLALVPAIFLYGGFRFWKTKISEPKKPNTPQQ
jgi:hypothetical protein